MSITDHATRVSPASSALRPGYVVVGVSNRFSAEERSIAAATQWAVRRRLDIKLVTGLGPGPRRREHAATHADRLRFARAELEAAADHLRPQLDPSQHVKVSVSEESGADALVRESSMAGVVVLQRRTLGSLARITAGSTTSAVAARADCPVLIVHTDDPAPTPGESPHGVLVAVDARGHAGHAIAEAFDEASWRGAPLTAAVAWVPAAPAYVPIGREESSDLHNAVGAKVAEQLAGYRERYPDVEVNLLLAFGEPVPALGDLASEHDLLVVARHGFGRRSPGKLGATTRRLIEEASGPVLVTPSSRPVSAPRHRHSLRYQQG